MRSPDLTSRPVYSTDTGKLCPSCGAAKDKCRCQSTGTGATSYADGQVRLRRETKGRKGKGVTLVDGLGMDPDALSKTAKQLKALCGSGGTVKNGIIEIQGDHRQSIKAWLEKQGFRCKLAGG